MRSQNEQYWPKTPFWGRQWCSGRVPGHLITLWKKKCFFHFFLFFFICGRSWPITVCLFPRQTFYISEPLVWVILSGQNSWLVISSISGKAMIILGNSNLASRMPQDSSTLFSTNIFNLIKHLSKSGKFQLDTEDPIVSSALITMEKTKDKTT